VAQTRRPRSGSKRPLPGWAILLLGLTLGVAVVLITQLVTSRTGDGLAALFRPAPKRSAPPTETVKRSEPTAVKPKLDFYTVLPEVETVLPERAAKAKEVKVEKPEAGTSFILQASSFANFEDADQLKAKLALQGLQAHIQKVSIEGKGDFYRVRLGPYDSEKALDDASQQLSKMGLKPMRLKVKKGAG
jgi:cell division protein FtsN